MYPRTPTACEFMTVMTCPTKPDSPNGLPYYWIDRETYMIFGC